MVYTFTVKTKNESGAGTDANIYLTLVAPDVINSDGTISDGKKSGEI